jgi:hypothetical protein
MDPKVISIISQGAIPDGHHAGIWIGDKVTVEALPSLEIVVHAGSRGEAPVRVTVINGEASLSIEDGPAFSGVCYPGGFGIPEPVVDAAQGDDR